jgi:ABC-type glycerol-3-phosphate transport system substrate-binding protein
VLEFWTSFAGEELTLNWFEKMASDFKALYPNVEVKPIFLTSAEYWTKLASAFAAGTPPDIFVTWGWGELKTYINEKQVADMTDLLNEAWAIKQIPPDAIKSVTHYNKKWALPYEFHSEWLFINRALFEKAGVRIPDESWTYTEFLEAIETFKKKGIAPIANSGKTAWTLNFWVYPFVERIYGSQAIYDLLARKASFEDIYVRPFTQVKALVDAKAFQEGWEAHGYMDAFRVFAEGKAAMWLQGTYITGMLKDFPDVYKNLDVLPFPYVPGMGTPKSESGLHTSYAVAEKSKHKKEAFDFLRFISQEKNVIEYAKMTEHPIAQVVPLPEGIYPPAITKALKWIADGKIEIVGRYATVAGRELGGYMGTIATEVFYGTKTPAEGAKALEEKAKELEKAGILPLIY